MTDADETSGGVHAEPTELEVLYARVGLHPSAPDFLLKAARKAYRTQNHPDKHSGDNKNEAEEAFKEMENIFDAIESLRQ